MPLTRFVLALFVPACMVGEGAPPPDHDHVTEPQPTTAVAASIAGGMFQSIAPYTGITGRALMVRGLDGKTDVSIALTGMTASVAYKFDPSVADARADNEIWFHLTSDAKGSAHDTTWVGKLARADAASIVVHAEDGARVACFDLR